MQMRSETNRQSSGYAETRLINTKLIIPPFEPGRVCRQRLSKKLDEVLLPGKRLALVSAPAGYGKTTAVGAWAHGLAQNGVLPENETPVKAAWLSLEAGDNHVQRFWAYVAAAVHEADPEVGREVLLLLQSLSGPYELTAPIAGLINELNGVEKAFVIILDDVHVLHAAEIFESMAFWIEHQPEHIRLVLCTRSDPPIPLARLRGNGQVVDVRAADLCFSTEETGELLQSRFGLAPALEDLRILQDSTEGWAAGIQMAGLAIRSQSRPGSPAEHQRIRHMIRGFSGKHVYILDYLAEEVLNRQPKPVQEFMLKTSILEGLCAELCDAVSDDGRWTADDRPPSAVHRPSSEILETLERANLFLIPLDHEHTWFRYHHLFAELLRARLRGTMPEQTADLHLRAARWYEQNGWIHEAVQHVLAAKNIEEILRLLKLHWQPTVNRGEVDRVLSWLRAAPEEILINDAHLCAASGWLYWLKGQMGEMEIWMNRAVRKLEQDGQGQGALKGSVMVLRAIHARSRGELAEAQNSIDQALSFAQGLNDSEQVMLRGVAHYHWGEILRQARNLDGAVLAYAMAIPDLKSARVTIAAASSHVWLIKIARLQGRLRAAFEESRRGLRFFEGADNPMQPAFGILLIAAAEIYLERNELAEAEDLLAQAMELGRLSGFSGIHREGNTALARLRLAQGDAPGALAAAQEAVRAAEKINLPDLLAETAAIQACLWIRLGMLEEANDWADSYRLPEKIAAKAGCLEIEALAYARLARALGKAEVVAPLLDMLLADAEAEGRTGSVLEILVLRALAKRKMGDSRAAQADLRRALSTAAPQGYARIFLDEAEAGYQLLKMEGSRLRDGENAAYMEKILSAFRPKGSGDKKPHQPVFQAERISERELEVLRFVAEGLSNREIGGRLFLTEGTVKAHVHTIYRKLGVQNRTQAAARARDTGLI